MVEKVFHDFVKGLCFYYERRDPREETLDLWFQEVKHIPDEPVDWMSEQIRSRHESFPRNLPLVMRELWQQWLEDHPQRRAQRNTEDGLSGLRRDRDDQPLPGGEPVPLPLRQMQAVEPERRSGGLPGRS